MIFFMTQRTTQEEQGCVAEFCPMCSEVRPFLVAMLVRRHYLYGVVPISEGASWYELTCAECQFVVSRAEVQGGRMPSPDCGIEALVKATNPDLLQHVDTLRQRAQQDLHDPEGRLQAMTRMVAVAAQEANLISLQNAKLDPLAGAVVGLGMGLPILVVLLIFAASEQLMTKPWIWGPMAAWGVVGLVGSIAVFYSQPWRLRRYQRLPQLVSYLQRFRPRRQEIQDVVARVREAGVPIPTSWTVDTMHTLLALPASSARSASSQRE